MCLTYGINDKRLSQVVVSASSGGLDKENAISSNLSHRGFDALIIETFIGDGL